LKERIDIAFYSKIVVVFSIIAGIYGMKYFGIVGVALATVTGNLLRNLFMFFVFKKQVKINYFFKEYLNVLFALVIIIVPFMFVVKFIDGVVTFLILNAIFAVVTLVVLTVLHPYNAMDLVYLEKIVSRSKFLRMVSRFILKIYSFTPNFLKKSI
jgi:O-antigen/teichoic acid export membrane protein